MPKTRKAHNYQVNVRRDDGSHLTAHVTLGAYEDGRLGEVWVDFGQYGSTLSVAMSAWAIALSLALQHGAHPHHIAHTFSDVREWRGHDVDSGEEVLSLYDAVAKLIRDETDPETGRVL
jgi:hypothetical protein